MSFLLDTHPLFQQLDRMRETLASPIPEPQWPESVFLRCDCCGSSMRSETSFLCRPCLQAHGMMSPEGQRLTAQGMEQVDEMHGAANEARASGRWN
jgi:hypothetical protein